MATDNSSGEKVRVTRGAIIILMLGLIIILVTNYYLSRSGQSSAGIDAEGAVLIALEIIGTVGVLIFWIVYALLVKFGPDFWRKSGSGEQNTAGQGNKQPGTQTQPTSYGQTTPTKPKQPFSRLAWSIFGWLFWGPVFALALAGLLAIGMGIKAPKEIRFAGDVERPSSTSEDRGELGTPFTVTAYPGGFYNNVAIPSSCDVVMFAPRGNTVIEITRWNGRKDVITNDQSCGFVDFGSNFSKLAFMSIEKEPIEVRGRILPKR